MTALLRHEGYLTPNLYVPFLQTSIPLSWPVYMAFAAFVMVGAVNAVNLTDGVDGLVSTVTLPVALFFAVVTGIWQQPSKAGQVRDFRIIPNFYDSVHKEVAAYAQTDP